MADNSKESCDTSTLMRMDLNDEFASLALGFKDSGSQAEKFNPSYHPDI